MVERLKEMWQDARQMRDERGLTLVELLVVVVILGIIAAISVVAIGGLIENSRKDAQVSNAKQLISSAKLYLAQNPLEEGGVADMGTFKGGTAIVDAAAVTGTTPVNRKVSLSKYLEEMKDPMNEDNPYSDAYVTVTNTAGKYSYAVTMKSSKAGTTANYFTADASPARSDLP